ncbi:hypothetical protein PHLH8_34380 [Pseudomonas sp. Pc102]|uniref:hypothetical protein n=1 Tax=Pseudomonas sp. Pc102 TaxID=2678261 RepID=UPI001BD130F1|nr:hypothetical protein [Pseudomonas sp. Pc102]BBP83796.1 hypothetical protein PHLH8_34380 [Pseudomonas sp. Pc102]
MRFSDEVAAAFPAANPLPSLLRQAIELMEAHGCVRTLPSGARYITLHPEPEFSDISTTSIHVPDPTDTRAWTNSEAPAVNERLVIFLRTGGDGSWAGLWLDDAGQQRVVHLGSGSGSVMLCVLTQTIEDLLRLLAIGYDELCWPEQFGVTPRQIKDADYEDADYPPPPRLFREHVERTLGLSIPPRAKEIIHSTASMDDDESSDPFWNWLKRVRGD